MLITAAKALCSYPIASIARVLLSRGMLSFHITLLTGPMHPGLPTLGMCDAEGTGGASVRPDADNWSHEVGWVCLFPAQ